MKKYNIDWYRVARSFMYGIISGSLLGRLPLSGWDIVTAVLLIIAFVTDFYLSDR